ncbi:hypothetical protein V1511DRAFT_507889 [Dipodascopsis uninucleata]
MAPASTSSSSSAAAGTTMVTTSSGIKLPMTAAMARSSGISLRTGRPKRKKASRACFHCQKAHLTCDDARPCQRCIKRGLQASCQDGIRKKAKYLNDASSNDQTNGSSSNSNMKGPRANSKNAVQHQLQRQRSVPNVPPPIIVPGSGTIDPSSLSARSNGGLNDEISSDSLFTNFDLSTYDFGSKTANLEYSYISNMVDTTADQSFSLSSLNNNADDGLMLGVSDDPGYDQSFADMSVRDSNWAARGLASLLSGNDNSPQTSESPPTPIGALYAGSKTPIINDNSSSIVSQNIKAEPSSRDGIQHAGRGNISDISVFSGKDGNNNININSSNTPLQAADNMHLSSQQQVGRRRRRDPETVYSSVTRPFSYTPGYHGLIAYLKSRFDKPHLMRVAKCMAAFRPSFIACTKTLKEEDLIFMEKCFQRTLLEYEKFISYSGTPTIVWRRTGQVAAVGKEFCILTGWTREQLLSKCTFVVELMDDHSVLEYFEGFSKLAFGDSRGATMMECTLLSPNGKKIPTACTWTIKRDVFDIPMMIVGNFLPILN